MPLNLSRTLLWGIAIFLFAALSGVAMIRVWPLLNPDVTESATADSACDLRAGPCMSSLPGGGRISLSITPQTIPVLKPLTLEVKLDGLDAGSVEVDFQGIDMNMGFNRSRLDPKGEGVYSGTATIPVCIRDAMEWEARVLARTDKGLVAAPFRFITVKPGMDLPNH